MKSKKICLTSRGSAVRSRQLPQKGHCKVTFLILRPVMFYVYILRSEKSGTYYKGQTSDLERRIKEHNNGEEKSTSRYVPWVLVWHTAVDSRSEALALEHKLKNMTGAKRIEDFIKRHSTN